MNKINQLKDFIDYDVIILYLQDKKIKTSLKEEENYILFFNHWLKENKRKIVRRARIRKNIS